MRYDAVALAGCLVLSSCATPPSRINAADMSGAGYDRLSCRELALESQKVQASLDENSKSQRDAVAGDAFGVFMIGVPMSSVMGGDKEAEISVEKGKIIAIHNAWVAKGCQPLKSS